MADQATGSILDAVGNLKKRLARLDAPLCPLANLAMGLGRMTIVGEEVDVQII